MTVQNADKLERKLDQLSKLDPKEALMEGAEKLAELARRYAPVKTGTLKNSIISRETAEGAQVTAEAPYAFFVEFGTSRMPAHPFLRPAIDENKSVTAEIKDEFKKELR